MSSTHLHTADARKALALLAAGLTLSACGGPGPAPDPQRDSSAAISLEVLDDTYIAGGKAAAITMTQSEQEGQTIVDVSVVGALALKGLFFKLHYEAQQYSPAGAELLTPLADHAELLSLSNTSAPGTLSFGEILLRPQDALPSGAEKGFSGDAVLARVRLKHSAFSPLRQLSSVAVTDASRTALAFNSDAFAFEWSYYSQGDYNQNGEVGISDLTPLGVHFNEAVPLVSGSPDLSSIQSVIDGDGNGQITLADLTPIGLNFGNLVANYLLYTDADGSNYPGVNDAPNTVAAAGSIAFSSALGSASGQRLHFSQAAAGAGAGHYWVRPADSSGSCGTPSNALDLSAGLPNPAPVVTLEADISSGTLPLLVNFTATAVDPNGDALEYTWDFGPAGGFANTGAVNTVAYTYNSSAQYTARVHVWDGNSYGNATTTVTVATPGGNVAPLVHLTANPNGGFSPLNVVLTAEVIDPDAGQTHTFEWDYENDLSIDFGPDPSPTWNTSYNYDFITGGFFTARVVVFDGFDYAESTTDISVNPPDNPPVFDFFTADVETGPAPLTVTFTASATDSDGDPVYYLYDFNWPSSFVSGSDVQMYTFNDPGSYTVFCRAEDGIEGTNSSPITIVVTAP